MKHIKKDAWMVATSKRPGPGDCEFAVKTHDMIITGFCEKSSPNLDREGGAPPYGLGAVPSRAWRRPFGFRAVPNHRLGGKEIISWREAQKKWT